MMEDIAETITRLYEQAQQALANDQLEDALATLGSLLPLLDRVGDRVGSARVLEQIGSAYELSGRLDAARESYQAALDLAPLDARQSQTILLHRLGHAWRAIEPFKARAFFLRSAALSDELGDRRGAALSRAMIGQIDFTAGNHETGMSEVLTALSELPADSSERSHLIEHTAYLSQQMDRDDFLNLIQLHVPPGPLAIALLRALANRPKTK